MRGSKNTQKISKTRKKILIDEVVAQVFDIVFNYPIKYKRGEAYFIRSMVQFKLPQVKELTFAGLIPFLKEKQKNRCVSHNATYK